MKIIDQKHPQAVDIAVNFLNQGKTIAFATDTVYGVAVDATNVEAVKRLYALKKRPESKPLAIFVKDIDQAQKLFDVSKVARKIMDKYMPGDITVILKTTDYAKTILAKNLNNNLNDFIGFRIIDSFFVRELFKKYSGILAVSSANKAYEDPCNTPNLVKNKLTDLDLLIAGKKTSKIASTIVKIVDDELTVIRQGKLIIKDYEY